MVSKNQHVEEGGPSEERKRAMQKIISFTKKALGFSGKRLSSEKWFEVEAMLVEAKQEVKKYAEASIYREMGNIS